MGKIVRKGVEYGGSSNSADCIKYNETKSVKTAIDDIKDTAMFIDSFDTNTGTLNTTSVSSGSSSNPTADSVTFDNANTGLEATNVQDAITEVNGKLENIFQGYKVAIFCENIPFTNGEAYYNTGFKNYKKLVVLVSNSGTTTKISATVPTESKGVIKLTATKYDGSSPTYTDTITMIVAYLE